MIHIFTTLVILCVCKVSHSVSNRLGLSYLAKMFLPVDLSFTDFRIKKDDDQELITAADQVNDQQRNQAEEWAMASTQEVINKTQQVTKMTDHRQPKTADEKTIRKASDQWMITDSKQPEDKAVNEQQIKNALVDMQHYKQLWQSEMNKPKVQLNEGTPNMMLLQKSQERFDRIIKNISKLSVVLREADSTEGDSMDFEKAGREIQKRLQRRIQMMSSVEKQRGLLMKTEEDVHKK
jgi:hypothetical protein